MVRFEFDPKDSLFCRIDRKEIPATILLKAETLTMNGRILEMESFSVMAIK